MCEDVLVQATAAQELELDTLEKGLFPFCFSAKLQMLSQGAVDDKDTGKVLLKQRAYLS
jgi:hypothetical protein